MDRILCQHFKEKLNYLKEQSEKLFDDEFALKRDNLRSEKRFQRIQRTFDDVCKGEKLIQQHYQDLQTELKRITNEKDEVLCQVDSLESDNQHLNCRKEELIAQVEQRKAELQEACDEASLKQLSLQYKEVAMEGSRLVRDVKETRNLLENKESDNKKDKELLKKDKNRLENMKNELAEKKQTVEKVEIELDELTQKSQCLRSEIKEVKDRRKRMLEDNLQTQALKNQLESSFKHIQSHHEENLSKIAESKDKICALEEEKKQLQNDQAQLCKKQKTLEKCLEQSQQELSKLEEDERCRQQQLGGLQIQALKKETVTQNKQEKDAESTVECC